MYLPKQFDEPTFAQDLIKENPFASLISNDDDGFPYVTHLPLHPDLKNGNIEILKKDNIKTIIGHRIGSLDNESIRWLKENLDYNKSNSYLNKLSIKAITWEEILKAIGNSSLNEFYTKCKIYNGIKE